MATEEEKEFSELTTNLNKYRRELTEVMVKLKSIDTETRRNEITKAELNSIPDDRTVYAGVGKAYLISSKKECIDELDAQNANFKKFREQLSEQRKILDAKFSEAEKAVAEHMTAQVTKNS